MAKEIDKALWMVNKSQAKLHSEKLILEKMVKNLLNDNNKQVSKKQFKLTINDLSKETGIPIFREPAQVSVKTICAGSRTNR